MVVTVREIFSFPDPANDYAARVVAGMVVAMASAIVLLQANWLLPVLAYGFVARVLTGPTLSPMGLLATRVLVPLFGGHEKPVPGPPKRFAQSIGAVFSVTAAMLHLVWGLTGAAHLLLGVLTFFAALEAFVGFCTGCFVFYRLMRLGLVPASVCETCYNVNLGRGSAGASAEAALPGRRRG